MPDRPARLARLTRTIRVTAALVVAMLGGGVYGALSVSTPAAPGRGAPPPTTSSLPAGRPVPTVPAGAVLVTGTAASVHAGDATGPNLSLPLQINVPVRGRGSATFYNVTVGGQPATVVWQGEQPLDLSGQGAVVPGRVDVDVDADGSVWHLDGAERELTPGVYDSGAPVAVGRGGLAQPEDTARFQAGDHSVLVTGGDATVRRTAMSLHLTGPGSLDLIGHFTVTTASRSSRSATAIHLRGGAYLVDLVPTPDGVVVNAVMADTAQVAP